MSAEIIKHVDFRENTIVIRFRISQFILHLLNIAKIMYESLIFIKRDIMYIEYKRVWILIFINSYQ